MESTYSSDRIRSIFMQIRDAIVQINEWNEDVCSSEDYYSSPDEMKNLAASCMLIEAIGEGVRQIDKLTQSRLWSERPEIPWIDVIGVRNHIAHGYFDIDGDIVFDIVKNNLGSLLAAVEYFLGKSEII